MTGTSAPTSSPRSIRYPRPARRSQPRRACWERGWPGSGLWRAAAGPDTGEGTSFAAGRPSAVNIRRAIQAAREQNVGVLCLPELCLTGYGCEDAFHATNTHQRAWKALLGLLPETRGMVVSFGLPVLHQNGLFNCAALAVEGKLVGLVAKRFLAGDGIHYEPRWFKAWPAGVCDEFTTPEGTKFPSATSISTSAASRSVLKSAKMRGWRIGRARLWLCTALI